MNNPFELDIAKLEFNTRWALSETALLALQSGNDKLAKNLEEVRVSVENVAKIQENDKYALEIEPLEDRIAKTANVDRSIKKRLNSTINPMFMPLASAELWAEALNFILDYKNPDGQKGAKKTDTLTETLLSSFPHMEGKDNGAMAQVQSVIKNVAGEKTSEDLIEAVVASYEPTIHKTESAKSHAAMTGITGRAVLWLEIVRQLAGFNRDAMRLLDQRRCTESSVLNVPTLEIFSDLSLGQSSVDIDKPIDLDKTTFEMTTSNRENFTINDEKLDTVYDRETGMYDTDRAMKSLVIHILNWAGADFRITKSTDPSQYEEAILLTLPIQEHVLGELLFERLSKAWFSFASQEVKQFQFMEMVIGMAQASNSQRKSAKKIRTQIMDTMRSDADEFTTSVREKLSTGDTAGIKKAVEKSLEKEATYLPSAICYFDTRRITTGTEVGDFAATGTVAFSSDKAIGLVNVPKGAVKGFSEGVLVKDPHYLQSVVMSSEMSEVGEMYNKIVPLATPTSNEYTMGTSHERIISDILKDYGNGLVRAADSSAKTLLASDLTGEAVFTPMHDYHVQVHTPAKQFEIHLPAGFGRVTHEVETVGSSHGTISFGSFKGQSPELGSPFVSDVGFAIANIAKDLFLKYAMKPVSFKPLSEVAIDLTEGNEKYEIRLNEIGTLFSNYTIDVDNIRGLLAAQSSEDHPSIKKQVPTEMVIALRRLDFKVRADVLSVVKTVSQDLYDRLTLSASSKVLAHVKYRLTRMLTQNEQANMNDSIFLNTVEAALGEIAKALDACKSETLRIVFLNELLSLIVATPDYVKEVKGGE
jgi:hypothetical protein